MITVINRNDIFYGQELKSVSIVNEQELVLNFTDTSVSVKKIEEDTEMKPIKIIAYRIHGWIYNVAEKNHSILDVEELAKNVFVKNNTVVYNNSEEAKEEDDEDTDFQTLLFDKY